MCLDVKQNHDGTVGRRYLTTESLFLKCNSRKCDPMKKKTVKGWLIWKVHELFQTSKVEVLIQPKYLWPLTLGPRRGLTRARILIFQCEKGRRQSTVLRKYYRLGNVRQSVAYWLWLENWDDKWREKGEMGKMRKWEWLSKWIPQSRVTPPQPTVDQAAPIFGKLKHNWSWEADILD